MRSHRDIFDSIVRDFSDKILDLYTAMIFEYVAERGHVFQYDLKDEGWGHSFHRVLEMCVTSKFSLAVLDQLAEESAAQYVEMIESGEF